MFDGPKPAPPLPDLIKAAKEIYARMTPEQRIAMHIEQAKGWQIAELKLAYPEMSHEAATAIIEKAARKVYG